MFHSGSPQAVPTVMKVGLPQLAWVRTSLCPRPKKKEAAASDEDISAVLKETQGADRDNATD